MKAIILAAGYGTKLSGGLDQLKGKDIREYERVRPFIEGKAKPMVELAGKPLIHYTVDNVVRAGIREIYVITNSKYAKQFLDWQGSYKGDAQLNIIDDGTKSNDDRLGAAGDLQYLLRGQDIQDDALVIGGDTLFTFELEKLVSLYNIKKTNVLVAFKERDPVRIKRSARLKLDENYLVTFFEEKPQNPNSEEWICPPVYIYTADTVKTIKDMDIPQEKRDHIGNIQFLLYQTHPFHAFTRDAKIRFDLGTIDDFESAEAYIKSLAKK